jgi:hypothetical protein
MRAPLLFVLGAAMCLLGAYVALRPLWSPRPLSPSRWLDMGFAALFLLRGWMNLRAARRPRKDVRGSG